MAALRGKVDCEVLGALVHCSTVRYAIIQASSVADHPERLVMAYPDENCLRDLIAAPSIIGLGFASREEATVNLVGSISNPNASERMRRPISRNIQREIKPARHVLDKGSKILVRMLQLALTAAIVLFYSKNPISTAIRMGSGIF
jgi:hypothetical protein